MTTAARKYKRIVQVGTQGRSGAHFQEVLDADRAAATSARSSASASARTATSCPASAARRIRDPPPGLDYDMWLGPAPKRPYNRSRALPFPLVLGLLGRPDDQPRRARHGPRPLRAAGEGPQGGLLQRRPLRAPRTTAKRPTRRTPSSSTRASPSWSSHPRGQRRPARRRRHRVLRHQGQHDRSARRLRGLPGHEDSAPSSQIPPWSNPPGHPQRGRHQARAVDRRRKKAGRSVRRAHGPARAQLPRLHQVAPAPIADVEDGHRSPSPAISPTSPCGWAASCAGTRRRRRSSATTKPPPCSCGPTASRGTTF